LRAWWITYSPSCLEGVFSENPEFLKHRFLYPNEVEVVSWACSIWCYLGNFHFIARLTEHSISVVMLLWSEIQKMSNLLYNLLIPCEQKGK
jgi:hypothetical protein